MGAEWFEDDNSYNKQNAVADHEKSLKYAMKEITHDIVS
jgi:hypothetical protein